MDSDAQLLLIVVIMFAYTFRHLRKLASYAFLVGLLTVVSSGGTAFAKPDQKNRLSSEQLEHTVMMLTAADLRKDSLRAWHLSKSDIRLYRQIFNARRDGHHNRIPILSKKLSDKSLMGWANTLVNFQLDPLNISLDDGLSSETLVYRSSLPRDAKSQMRAHEIANDITQYLREDKLDTAYETLTSANKENTIDRVETALLMANVASAAMYNGDAKRALGLAHLSLQIGGTMVPKAAWVAGVSSWVIGDHARAARYFAWPVRSPYAGPWLRSASAYWTARALTRGGHYHQVSAWLREAARNPRSFYGLMATRALGTQFSFNWTVPPFNNRHKATLAANRGAIRALKLIQIGQTNLARQEFAQLDIYNHDDVMEALSALAIKTLSPDTIMRVADMLGHPKDGPLDAALYPVSPWQPKDGYRLEPALINAFIRQESGFKPSAGNKGSGASGLLQMMPRTARAMKRGTNKKELNNPETNLALGQKYLSKLLNQYDGDLLQTAIAYNAGPGRLSEWKERYANVNDPLLFIELIPYGETRAYVERVMANYWMYSLRMGLPVESLDALASGKPARYASFEKKEIQIVLGAR